MAATEGQAEFLQNSATALTIRQRSPQVWAGCPLEQIRAGKIDGIHLFDDFAQIGSSTTAITTDGTLFPSDINWAGFGDTGSTILPSTALQNGAVTLGSNDDNEAAVLHSQAAPFKIALGEGSLWFEARWKITTTTVTILDFFIGLMEKTLATAIIPITATAGRMADKNLIGFLRAGTSTAGDGSLINMIYKADGQPSATTHTTLGSKASALTADTYIKTAFTYNEKDGKIRWFLDNVLQTSTYSLVSTAGNPFPNDIVLGPIMGTVNTAGSITDIVTIDWIRIAQVAAGQGFYPAV